MQSLPSSESRSILPPGPAPTFGDRLIIWSAASLFWLAAPFAALLLARRHLRDGSRSGVAALIVSAVAATDAMKGVEPRQSPKMFVVVGPSRNAQHEPGEAQRPGRSLDLDRMVCAADWVNIVLE